MRTTLPRSIIGAALIVWFGTITGFAEQAAVPPPHTVLLAGKATTWLDLAKPPYEVVITLKMKLERAGFQVTMDSRHPYDLVLDVTYRETPGREYRRLERGTNILCELVFWNAASKPPQKLWMHRIETGTSWPTPVGSLYWEAVQNLEENPYYYYVGDLFYGLVTAQEDAGAVFTRMLAQKKLGSSTTESGGFQAMGHVVANAEARLNAVRELGRLKDRRALPTLWNLVEQATRSDKQEDVAQREAAITAIGEIGDPASLDRLSALYNTETDDGLRAVLEKAMARIREQQAK